MASTEKRITGIMSGSSKNKKEAFVKQTLTELKSKESRPKAALAAARLFSDYNIIKNFGVKLVPALLHALDLPEQDSWPPAIVALTILFEKIHNLPDLTRQIGISRLSDYIKRIVTRTLDKVPQESLKSMISLIQRYPGQFRSYHASIKSGALRLVKSTNTIISELAIQFLALLPFSDKDSGRAWENEANEIINDLKQHLSGNIAELKFFDKDTDKSVLWKTLTALVCSPTPFEKRISSTSISEILFEVLEATNSSNILMSLNFINTTFPFLVKVYLESFTRFLDVLSVASGTPEFQTIAMTCAVTLLESGGWIHSRYTRVVSNLCREALKSLESRTPQDVMQLADYVSNPSVFEVQPDTTTVSAALGVLEAALKATDSLPSSLRSQIDRIFLKHGGRGLETCVLYPDKYSILPQATVEGLQNFSVLIHPRLPPLPARPQPSFVGVEECSATEMDLVEENHKPNSIDAKIEQKAIFPLKEEFEELQSPKTESEPLPDTNLKTQPSSEPPKLFEPEQHLPVMKKLKLASDDTSIVHRDVHHTSREHEEISERDGAESESDSELEIPQIVMDDSD